MCVFCDEIENNPKYSFYKEECYSKITEFVGWYISQHKKYSAKLRTEMDFQTISEEINKERELFFDLSSTIDAKLSYFIVSDTLVKLILCKFSYGPDENFLIKYGINIKRSQDSWLECKESEFVLTEILAKVLRDENYQPLFDLQGLFCERSNRNDMVHKADMAICISAMRSYNSIREMIIFLDNKYKDELPVFTYNNYFSYDKFLAKIGYQNFFHETTTILIVDSVHDVKYDERKAVANLPWDIVIDLDGYSENCGLLNAVEHNSIIKEYEVHSGQHLTCGKTLWYRCGDYQIPYSNSKNHKSAGLINGYDEFKVSGAEKNRYSSYLSKMFKIIIDESSNTERPLLFVAVTNDSLAVQQLINVCSNKIENYFCVWVGMSIYDVTFQWDPSEDPEEHYFHISAPTHQFYQEIYKRKDSFENLLPLREKKTDEFLLPTDEGYKPVPENYRNRLAQYFDVLYKSCENVASEVHDQNRSNFYKAGLATWDVIDDNSLVTLISESEINKVINNINTNLGQINDNNKEKRIFFLKHTPGLGGTTLARQIVWRLHNKHSVFVVNKYDSANTVELLKDVYSNVLYKSPFIILADDTLLNLSNLCDDIKRINIRCCLLISCRSENVIIKDYKAASKIEFRSIKDEMFDRLKNKIRQVCIEEQSFSEQEINQKDQDINNMVEYIRNPFILGLYYREKEFNIKNYVEKAIENKSYDDVLACLAMCDRFGCKDVPKSIVTKMARIDKNGFRSCSFNTVYPASESLIYLSRREKDVVDYYHFKHPLLSKEYLISYSKKYYNTEESKNMYYNLSLNLIDTIASMDKLQDNHLNLLINILIQYKGQEEDISQNEDNSGKYSALINTVGAPGFQKKLMLHLAEAFSNRANNIREKQINDNQYIVDSTERSIMRLVSHACAHLGRMYSVSDKNYVDAQKYFDLAIKYMPDNDPNIYHMAGMSLLKKFREKLDSDKEYKLNFVSLESDVDLISDYFDYASDYGSPEYGIPSKLALFYKYLAYVYKRLEIKNENDFNRLSETQVDIQNRFINAIDEADAYTEFDRDVIYTIDHYRDCLCSEIIFNNFGKAKEYYQNKVDKYKNSNPELWENALRNLVSARIYSAKKGTDDKVFYWNMSEKDREILFRDISELLSIQVNVERYSNYCKLSALYHHWMELAKTLNKPIEDCIFKAEQWAELEKRNKQNINLEPYYYLVALYYLDALNGAGLSFNKAQAATEEIERIIKSEKHDLRRYSSKRCRDLLVKGSGAGQLLNVSHCKNNEEIVQEVCKRNCTPLKLGGKYNKTIDKSLAVLKVYEPVKLDGLLAYVDIGRYTNNSLSEGNEGHKIEFFAGFSIERPVAISKYAKDISRNETLDIQEVMEQSRNEIIRASKNTEEVKEESISAKKVKTYICHQNVLAVGNNAVFIPEYIYRDRNYDGAIYLNGRIGQVKAGVNEDDILRYGSKVIESYGGINEVFNELIKIGSVPCVIKKLKYSFDKLESYNISVFDSGSDIVQLLNGETISNEQNESITSADIHNKDEIVLPDLRQKTVLLIVDDNCTESISGYFNFESQKYVAKVINVSNKKRIKELKKKKQIQVVVVDRSKTGYSVKIK